MSKPLDNYTAGDSLAFQQNIHREANGYWKPIYPSEVSRPLKHAEADFNFTVLSETLTGYRVFPEGQIPSNHPDPENFSNDENKILSLKKEGSEYYWTLNDRNSIFPPLDGNNNKVLKIKSGELKWEPDIDTFINSTTSLTDFPPYEYAGAGKILKIVNGALAWADDGFGQLPSLTNNNGKVLKVENDGLVWGTATSETSDLADFPDYDANFNGSALKVVNGQLEWIDIGAGGLPTIEGNEYRILTANEDYTKWQSFPGNIHKTIQVLNPVAGKYAFAGYDGINPTVELERGKIYTFDWRSLNQQGGVQHPFRILDIGDETIPAGGYTSDDGGQQWGRQRDLETLSPDLVYSTDAFYHNGTYGYVDPNQISMVNDFSLLQKNETEVDLSGGLDPNDWWIDEVRQVTDEDGIDLASTGYRTGASSDAWATGVILKEPIKRSKGQELEIEFEYKSTTSDDYFLLGLMKAPSDLNNPVGTGGSYSDFGYRRIAYGFYGQGENIITVKPYSGGNASIGYLYTVAGDGNSLAWKFDKEGNYDASNQEFVWDGDEKNPFFPWIRGFNHRPLALNNYFPQNYPNETPLAAQPIANDGDIYKIIFTPQEVGCRMEFSCNGKIIRSFLYKQVTEENLYLGINFFGRSATAGPNDSLTIRHIKIRNTPFKPSALRSEYIFTNWENDGTIAIGPSDWGGRVDSFNNGLLSNRIFDIDAEPELTYTFVPETENYRNYHNVGFWDEQLYSDWKPNTSRTDQNDLRAGELLRYGIYIQGSNILAKSRSSTYGGLIRSIRPFYLTPEELDLGWKQEYSSNYVRQMRPDGDSNRLWHDIITAGGNNNPWLFGDIAQTAPWDPSEGFQQKVRFNLHNKHYQFNNTTLSTADWHFANLIENPTSNGLELNPSIMASVDAWNGGMLSKEVFKRWAEPEVTVEWTQLGTSYDYDMHYLMGWYKDTSPSGNELDETDLNSEQLIHGFYSQGWNSMYFRKRYDWTGAYIRRARQAAPNDNLWDPSTYHYNYTSGGNELWDQLESGTIRDLEDPNSPYIVFPGHGTQIIDMLKVENGDSDFANYADAYLSNVAGNERELLNNSSGTTWKVTFKALKDGGCESKVYRNGVFIKKYSNYAAASDENLRFGIAFYGDRNADVQPYSIRLKDIKVKYGIDDTFKLDGSDVYTADLTGGLIASDDWWTKEIFERSGADGVTVGTIDDRNPEVGGGANSPWESGIIYKKPIRRNGEQEMCVEFEYMGNAAPVSAAGYHFIGLMTNDGHIDETDDSDFTYSGRVQYGIYFQGDQIMVMPPNTGYYMSYPPDSAGGYAYKYDRDGTGQKDTYFLAGDERHRNNPFVGTFKGYTAGGDAVTQITANGDTPMPAQYAVAGDVWKLCFIPGDEKGCQLVIYRNNQWFKEWHFDTGTEEMLYLQSSFFGTTNTGVESDIFKLKSVQVRNALIDRDKWFIGDSTTIAYPTGTELYPNNNGPDWDSGVVLKDTIKRTGTDIAGSTVKYGQEIDVTFDHWNKYSGQFTMIGLYKDSADPATLFEGGEYSSDGTSTDFTYYNMQYGVYFAGSRIYMRGPNGTSLLQSVPGSVSDPNRVDNLYNQETGNWDRVEDWKDPNFPYLLGWRGHGANTQSQMVNEGIPLQNIPSEQIYDPTLHANSNPLDQHYRMPSNTHFKIRMKLRPQQGGGCEGEFWVWNEADLLIAQKKYTWTNQYYIDNPSATVVDDLRFGINLRDKVSDNTLYESGVRLKDLKVNTYIIKEHDGDPEGILNLEDYTNGTLQQDAVQAGEKLTMKLKALKEGGAKLKIFRGDNTIPHRTYNFTDAPDDFSTNGTNNNLRAGLTIYNRNCLQESPSGSGNWVSNLVGDDATPPIKVHEFSVNTEPEGDGTTTIKVPWDYPKNELAYLCGYHTSMQGTINIVGEPLPSITPLYTERDQGKILQVGADSKLEWTDSPIGDSSPGNQGFQGQQGERGFQGYQGHQGADGDDGERGFQGYQGDQGADGDDGERGFQGYQGDQGERGEDGAAGNDAPTPIAHTFVFRASGMQYVIDETAGKDISVFRGQTYRFDFTQTAQNHPLMLIIDGVEYASTTASGNIHEVTIPMDATSFSYQCEIHSSMTDTIDIYNLLPEELIGPAGPQGADADPNDDELPDTTGKEGSVLKVNSSGVVEWYGAVNSPVETIEFEASVVQDSRSRNGWKAQWQRKDADGSTTIIEHENMVLTAGNTYVFNFTALKTHNQQDPYGYYPINFGVYAKPNALNPVEDNYTWARYTGQTQYVMTPPANFSDTLYWNYRVYQGPDLTATTADITFLNKPAWQEFHSNDLDFTASVGSTHFVIADVGCQMPEPVDFREITIINATGGSSIDIQSDKFPTVLTTTTLPVNEAITFIGFSNKWYNKSHFG